MVMFSIIQLGFTRFLTDRKEWIYLPPLRYMCVCGVVGYPTSGGVLPVFGCHFGFLPRKKNATRPLHMPIGLAHHGPETPGLGA